MMSLNSVADLSNLQRSSSLSSVIRFADELKDFARRSTLDDELATVCDENEEFNVDEVDDGVELKRFTQL